jgi:nitrile hydratase
MDGIHDLGGKHGFGQVERETDEPVFHAKWEAKVFTFMLAGGAAGAWLNSDRFRHNIERINPISYLNDGYYGRWLGGIETGLVEAGVLDSAEIQFRYRELGGSDSDRIAARPVTNPEPLGKRAQEPGSQRIVASPKFAVGDLVKTDIKVTPGHTRLPAYARGKVGKIVACHDGWIYPDSSAHGLGEDPQNLYTVEFQGDELWGSDSESMTLCLDLFEPYLHAIEG